MADNPKPAAGGRARAPMTPMQQRFILTIALICALMACLWGAASLQIPPQVYSGLSVVIGATIVPALKRAFDYFFPARGSDDPAGHG